VKVSADSRTTPPPEYRTQSADTGFDVERLPVEAYRRMPSWEKARRMGDMVQAIDARALAGIIARHPHAPSVNAASVAPRCVSTATRW
jgi:hypothetical protein